MPLQLDFDSFHLILPAKTIKLFIYLHTHTHTHTHTSTASRAASRDIYRFTVPWSSLCFNSSLFSCSISSSARARESRSASRRRLDVEELLSHFKLLVCDACANDSSYVLRAALRAMTFCHIALRLSSSAASNSCVLVSSIWAG